MAVSGKPAVREGSGQKPDAVLGTYNVERKSRQAQI
jgi:hypothetical protein